MALITCPKCGKSISDKAIKCPSCGISKQEIQNVFKKSENRSNPISPLLINDEFVKENQKNTISNIKVQENITNNTKKEKKTYLNTDIIKKYIIGFVAVILIIIIIVMWRGFEENGVFRKIYNKTGFCISHEYLEATCTEPKHCDICGKSIGESIGHSYKLSATVEPTCTINGKMQYICERCDDTYYEVIDALGHIYNDDAEMVDATCTENGIFTYNCTQCGEVIEEEIPALGHKWIEATCTTPRICEICNEIDGSPLGHTTVNGICNRCGELAAEPIEFSGNGDTVLKDVNIPEGMYKIYFTHDGTRNFIIHAYSSDNKRRGWMNEIGNFSGYIFSGEPIIDGMIEVKADGNWTISVMQIEEGGTSNIRGHGMCVTPYFELEDAPLVVHMTNTNGKSNFIVHMYDEEGKRISLSNEIGEYEGEKILDNVVAGKKYCIVVDSDGNWSIDFGLNDRITTVSNTY